MSTVDTLGSRPQDMAEVRIDGHHRAYTPQEVAMMRLAKGMGVVPAQAFQPEELVGNEEWDIAARRRQEIAEALSRAVDVPL